MKSISNHASIPNPTPLFFLMAGTIAWCLFWVDDPGSPWLMLALLVTACVLVPVSITFLVNHKEVALTILMLAVVMPRFFVQISTLKARPEHLACGLLLLVAPFWLTRRSEPMKWFAPDYILGAYLGMNLFSSLVMSTDPSQTIKWAMQQIIVVMAYFFVRILVDDRASFRRAFNIALMVGVSEAVYGIFCFYSNLLFGTEFGMEMDQYGSIPGTYGTQFEANLLGSYCGACSAIMLVMFLRKQDRKYLIGFAVTFAAMAISLSRGALLGTLIALAIVVYRSRENADRDKVKKLAIAMLCIAVTIAPAIIGLWSERLSTVEISDISEDDTTRDRVITLGLASDGILEHPFLGNGTSSFQLQFTGADFGQDEGTPGWIGNTETRVLYDTGLVGLGLFGAFLISLIVGVTRLAKAAPNPEIEALTMALAVYCVSFQFTEGTLLAFPWVHLGLIASGLVAFREADGDTHYLLPEGLRPNFNTQ